MKKSIIALSLLIVAASACVQFFAGIDAKAGVGRTLEFVRDHDRGVWSSVGINAGYEFIRHIPVSVGIEYTALRPDKESLFRVCLKTQPLRLSGIAMF